MSIYTQFDRKPTLLPWRADAGHPNVASSDIFQEFVTNNVGFSTRSEWIPGKKSPGTTVLPSRSRARRLITQ